MFRVDSITGDHIYQKMGSFKGGVNVMEVNITPKQLERLRRASDITEIQMLMAKFVECFSKMEALKALELFATDDDNVSIELAECGGYDGPKQVKAFLTAYDEYLKDPSDKRGWMELQNICNPTVKVSKNHEKAVGYWTILAPSAKWGMPYPCDEYKLTAHWGCGKYIAEFKKTNEGWKILKLQLVWFLRSPFELGWMRQPDCVHMPVLQGVKPDREPDYFNIYNADYGCASGGIEWGPYLPDEIE